jgi:hypothetical protein
VSVSDAGSTNSCGPLLLTLLALLALLALLSVKTSRSASGPATAFAVHDWCTDAWGGVCGACALAR